VERTKNLKEVVANTHFQNAAIKQICEPPYFIFVALQDIEPGTEIRSSYGPITITTASCGFPKCASFFAAA
jgi:hypothetical protein